MNYIFAVADELSRKPAETLSQEILEHLYAAEEKLAEIFGLNEWNQLNLNDLTLNALPETHRKAISAQLGEPAWQAVASKPLGEIEEEQAEQITAIVGNQTQNRIYRDLLLRTITESWVEYLTKMEALRVSISMESYAQRDPLVQYKRQASTMFSDLFSEVRQGVISYMFRYRPVKPSDASADSTNSKQSSKSSKKKRRKRH